MKLVGILGSARKGNSMALFEAFAEGAEAAGADVESVWLKTLDFTPCRACESCFKTGVCIVKDDLQNIVELIDSIDALALTTPVQFGGPSAYMSMFFSRCQQYFGRKYVLKLPDRPHAKSKGAGILIAASAADNPDYFTCVKRISRYVFNTLDFTPRASLWVPGLEEPGDAKKNPEALERARELGELVAQERWDVLRW